MKCGVRVALGVAGGYFLGRTKKMKLAMMMAGMAAGRQAGGPRGLLAQGANLLNASPELSRLTDEVRGRLLEAGKGAALAIAARQVESLTDRVGKRVESLGSLGAQDGGKSRADADSDADSERADEYDEYEEAPEQDRAADEDEAVDESGRRPAAAKRATATVGTARRATGRTAGAQGRSTRRSSHDG